MNNHYRLQSAKCFTYKLHREVITHANKGKIGTNESIKYSKGTVSQHHSDLHKIIKIDKQRNPFTGIHQIYLLIFHSSQKESECPNEKYVSRWANNNFQFPSLGPVNTRSMPLTFREELSQLCRSLKCLGIGFNPAKSSVPFTAQICSLTCRQHSRVIRTMCILLHAHRIINIPGSGIVHC